VLVLQRKSNVLSELNKKQLNFVTVFKIMYNNMTDSVNYEHCVVMPIPNTNRS